MAPGFSTKYYDADLDDVTTTDVSEGLYYYGYRYYGPQLGRWLSRDPIGERRSRLLFGYVENDAANAVDPLGLCKRIPPTVYLPSKIKANWDYARRFLWYLSYWTVSRAYVDLNAQMGARIMSQSFDIRNLMDAAVRRQLSEGACRPCGASLTWGKALHGSAYTEGAWTDIIGRFTYKGYVRCWTTKKCSPDCTWRVSTYCAFEFDGCGKYDFLGRGEPWERPGVLGTLEDCFWATYLLHWTWTTSASGVYRCVCRNTARVQGESDGPR